MLLDLPTAARYNAWANKRLYAVAEQLSAAELAKDRKGFFCLLYTSPSPRD